MPHEKYALHSRNLSGATIATSVNVATLAALAGAPLNVTPGGGGPPISGTPILAPVLPPHTVVSSAHPGALLLGGLNGVMGVGEGGDLSKAMPSIVTVKNEPGFDGEFNDQGTMLKINITNR
jgi:hypothetical protein